MMGFKKNAQFALYVFALFSCRNRETTTIEPDLHREYFAARNSYEQGDYQNAYTRFLDLMTKAKNFLPIQLQLAKTQILLGQLEEADKRLRKIVKKKPEYYEARLWYARLVLQQGNYRQAERLLRELLQLDSSASQVYYYMAILYSKDDFSEHNLALALQYIKQANALSKEQLAYQLHEQARLYIGMQNSGEAIRLLRQSSSLLNTGALHEANQEILNHLRGNDETNDVDTKPSDPIPDGP